MTTCITPKSIDDFKAYFQFRWLMLRAPWHQAQGSEQDDLEDCAIHRMLVNDNNDVIAIGRLHKLDQFHAQIRYMAVHPSEQGKGLGRVIIEALETEAKKLGVKKITLNARNNALVFYQKLGYDTLEASHVLYGEIPHTLMEKELLADKNSLQNKTQALESIWHQTIPMSKAMGIGISYFDGNELITYCDLQFNKNLHNTMFAGSIYTLATLTGWGWVYLQLAEAKLAGDIVLADANIRYLAPVKSAANGVTQQNQTIGDLTLLAKGRKAKITIDVNIVCGDVQVAIFQGTYVVIPKNE